jgi:hypothetical protein
VPLAQPVLHVVRFRLRGVQVGVAAVHLQSRPARRAEQGTGARVPGWPRPPGRVAPGKTPWPAGFGTRAFSRRGQLCGRIPSAAGPLPARHPSAPVGRSGTAGGKSTASAAAPAQPGCVSARCYTRPALWCGRDLAGSRHVLSTSTPIMPFGVPPRPGVDSAGGRRPRATRKASVRRPGGEDSGANGATTTRRPYFRSPLDQQLCGSAGEAGTRS